MASKSKRREQWNKRKRHGGAPSSTFDLHARAITDSWSAMAKLMGRLVEADDPSAALESAFDEAVARLVGKVRQFDVFRLVETARPVLLPMAPEGRLPVDPEAAAAHIELLALVAIAARGAVSGSTAGESAAASVSFQEMSRFVSGAKSELTDLLQLAQFRQLASVDRTDKLAFVSFFIQGAEVWIRNSSYQEMVQETNIVLLDGDPTVRAALNSELGFDATDAIAVLNACHDLQLKSLDDRAQAMGDAVRNAMESTQSGEPGSTLKEIARDALMSLFEPDADQSTVAAEDIASRTGIAEERVRSVIGRFRLELGSATPTEVIDAFSTGKNPLRTRPLIVSDTGRVMLPHSVLTVGAVRENLEDHLKPSSTWNKYQKHRGDLLESRTRDALGRVLPDAGFRHGFEYYVPASEVEEKAADPSRYTKRVEGDHLVVVDDVAIIVEDKAVALSALARGGKSTRVRNDLTGIITKAADQARRMRTRIERDGGLRIDGEGWVDLRHVREIHTVAVSLDDLSTVLTATAELVRAGILEDGNIPWAVSLHDLELITELITRPAEFLLYIRRRRNADATVLFKASDELDLFLYFFEAGLWVEPDPEQMRVSFPYMPAPTKAEKDRYYSQHAVIISSRTDALDRWFYSKGKVGDEAPKPAMAPSPITSLVDELQSRKVFGWLSIGATLLSVAADAQREFAGYGGKLLDNPSPEGNGRRATVPFTASTDPAEGWLMVWATRTANEDPAATERSLRDYLRVKKHQLGLPRGAVFLYDERTRALADIYYDWHGGPFDSQLAAALDSLQPAAAFQQLYLHTERPVRAGNSNSNRNKKRRKR